MKTYKKSTETQIIPLLKEAVSTFLTNPIILMPYLTGAFLQLLILEILYFAPRYPLSVIFGPLFKYYGEVYLHYPFNLLVLPRMYQYTQIPLYLFVGSFLIGVAIAIIAALNNNEKISFTTAVKKTSSKYVHIVVAASIAFAIFYGIYYLHGLTIVRALKIKSASGIFYILKSFVLQGSPIVHLLIGVFVTTLFAYVFPIIVIENKKVFSAILLNFKTLWRSWWFTFAIVLIPMLFYIPVLLLRNNIAVFADKTFPDIRFMIMILGILIMMIIDATVYTALTMNYLVKKEHK